MLREGCLGNRVVGVQHNAAGRVFDDRVIGGRKAALPGIHPNPTRRGQAAKGFVRRVARGHPPGADHSDICRIGHDDIERGCTKPGHRALALIHRIGAHQIYGRSNRKIVNRKPGP